jgi:hypothetical protein
MGSGADRKPLALDATEVTIHCYPRSTTINCLYFDVLSDKYRVRYCYLSYYNTFMTICRRKLRGVVLY